jgi:sec-independent protein translocase protein TatB
MVFNLQGGEIIIILLLALVVLGPEKLPDAMRRAGKAYAEFKKMSTTFQQEFRSVVDEPMREMRETANLLRDSADFRKLQDGDRKEKPHTAQMAEAPKPEDVPTADVPFRAASIADALARPTVSAPDPFGAALKFSAVPHVAPAQTETAEIDSPESTE